MVSGFLLTLPFQQRFDVLSGLIKNVYLATVACAIGATLLLVAPVAMHRMLFRQHRLLPLVSTTHRCEIAGVMLLGAALVVVAIVIFYAVSGAGAGWIVGACAAGPTIVLWILLPVFQRAADDQTPGQH